MILEQSPLPFHTSVPTVLGYPAWKRALQESLSYNLVQLTLYILGVQLCLLCGRQLHYEGTWCFSQFYNSCNANLIISLSKKIRDLYFCSLFWRFKFNIEPYSFLPPLMNVTHHLQEQVLSAQNRRQGKLGIPQYTQRYMAVITEFHSGYRHLMSRHFFQCQPGTQSSAQGLGWEKLTFNPWISRVRQSRELKCHQRMRNLSSRPLVSRKGGTCQHPWELTLLSRP